MTSSGSGSSGDIFDVKRIRRLVELMNEHELAEIDLRQADQRIRLRKGGDPLVTIAPVRPAAHRRRAARLARRRRSRPPAKVDDKDIVVIKSPMVGTFYASASPDSPRVREGRRPRRPPDDGLSGGSDEGLQRDSGRSVG